MYCVDLYETDGECSLGSFRLFEQAEANALFEAIDEWGKGNFYETRTGYARLDDSATIVIEYKSPVYGYNIVIDKFCKSITYPPSTVDSEN